MGWIYIQERGIKQLQTALQTRLFSWNRITQKYPEAICVLWAHERVRARLLHISVPNPPSLGIIREKSE